ncbi:DUF1611 domain-containing protein [Aquaticitalea lipolytica]|uniref:DUF1611 domain-containing protein n=1 Tax=Aquaticitalea lipolytica TaxID=1247562 RepID=A0A8J2TPC0_9FLAO|nr:hypothetical protein [Aquaticitalea lipolytica]GFZ79565.1 DUF1611 domain-containing protein [Aquaticitalea lipolytica]
MKTIKKSIITKSVENFKINRTIRKTYMPKSGDVAVFQVISIGKHSAIQAENGNNTYIFPGDKILATFGNRYATAQFEGYVPKVHHNKYQILGQGGVVGVLASLHAKLDDVGPTEVKLIGYAVNEENQVINTIYNGVERETFNPIKNRPYEMYLSVGASMDSGKTTTAAFLSRGFMQQKKKVAFIKLTGTVFAKDCSIVRDCGAKTAVDFSYCGYPSTFLHSTNEILDILETLLKRVERINPDVVVIEIADGLFQRETKSLINHKPLMNMIDGVLLSCADSLAVNSGIEILRKINKEPILISGIFTASPLMIDEVKNETNIPVFTLEDFTNKINFGSVFPNIKALINA